MTLCRCCMQLAQGGTAVGTGLNAPVGFAERLAERIARDTGLPFISAPNKFEALASHDAMVELSGALNTVAASLFKIAKRHRLMGSGPRSGICRTVTARERARLFDHAGQGQSDAGRGADHGLRAGLRQPHHNHHGGRQGHFELNVYNPLMAYNFLQSVRLHGRRGGELHRSLRGWDQSEREASGSVLERSLMLVTALAPKIGYDKAAKIAKTAHKNGTTLREEALALGFVSEEDFNTLVRPELMLKPGA